MANFISVTGGRDGAGFRKRVVALCRDQGLLWQGKPSMRALAMRCGVSESVARRWFQTGMPSLPHLATLGRTFNVSVDWLVTGRDVYNPAVGAASAASKRTDPVYLSRRRSDTALGADIAHKLLEVANNEWDVRDSELIVLAGDLRDPAAVLDLVVRATLPTLRDRLTAVRRAELLAVIERASAMEAAQQKASSRIQRAMLAPQVPTSALQQVIDLFDGPSRRKPVNTKRARARLGLRS